MDLRKKKQTTDHIQKRIESRRKNGNFVISETTREKMRKSYKGGNQKKHYSETTREKIRLARTKQIMPKGEKSHFWKGGITPEKLKIRMSIEYRIWREAVFIRDNFTCQKYGIMGGKLEAHHKDNFADFPELRLAIDNGITLSEKAHIEFHSKYGRKNNTRQQLEEFLKF